MTILETERLRLRPLTIQDAEALHQLLDQDEAMWHFTPGRQFSFSDRIKAIEKRLTQYAKYRFGCFAVERKEDTLLVGQAGLSPFPFKHRDGSTTEEFEVMFQIGLAYQNQGYATEATTRWIQYAFETAKLPRLIVCPAKANVASVRLLQKLGFRFEDDWLEPETVLSFLENNA